VSVAKTIIAARACGVVHCGRYSTRSATVSEVALEFGLADDPSYYTEIDVAAAHRVIVRILHRDMAYDTEVMPEVRAVELADRFLAQFGSPVRYFTNGTWHLPPDVLSGRVIGGAGWNPVTPATFDAGVLAIGPTCSGCLWIEDED
jgi:hypothetical protein